MRTIEHRTEPQDLLDLVPDQEPAHGATEKQLSLMRKLIEELGQLDEGLAIQATEYTDRMTEGNRWTQGRNGKASQWINRLIAKVDELRKTQPTEIEDGMYLLHDEVYKVQHAMNGSGRQYAKRLIPNDPGQRASFTYAPGIIRKLRPEHRMTMEQAREFGALYGTCCVCGAVLTNEDSIDAGIGPICRDKM